MQTGRPCPMQPVAAWAYESGVGMINCVMKPAHVVIFAIIFVSTNCGACTTHK